MQEAQSNRRRFLRREPIDKESEMHEEKNSNNRDSRAEESEEGLKRPLVGEANGDGDPVREQWRKRVSEQKGEERF